MNNLRLSTGLMGLAILSAIPAFGTANVVTLRRDTVIPVVFEDKLTVQDNRPGDFFTVRVTDNDFLPHGSELLGRIDRIHPARGNRPASMDLRFVKILLPDNSRVLLDASPIPMDDRYITRTGDGRIIAKSDVRQQQNDVLGGAIGGFIVGSILHRRVAGTIIGTMVGVVAAENDRAKGSNLVVNSGDRVGALINHDVTIDFSGAPARLGEFDRPSDAGPRGSNQGPITIGFKKNDVRFPDNAKPYWIGDVIMVPLEPAARQMELDVDQRKDRVVYINGPESSMRIMIASRQARLDGKNFDLPRTVVEREGMVYVPLDALLPLIKADVYVNGTIVDKN